MKHNQVIVPILILLMGMFCPLVMAQEKPAQDDAKESAHPKSAVDTGAELDAIRQASHDFVEAFNCHNASAVAASWTEDGDYIDESGRVIAGREAIEKKYSQFFKEHDDVKIRVVIDSLRLLSADAAIEDGHAILEPAPSGPPAISKYTAVHVKAGGKWRMSTVRDTRIETPSAYRNVEDLEWLIGTWTAEERGAKTVSVCHWVANKSFVQRDYTVTHVDGTTTSGVQLIGWNAQEGHVQSWNFSADGGHAVGVWTPRENGWQAELRGITGDGTSTSAVVLLTRIDDNAYVWQSLGRTAGDVALPDTDEVVLKRKLPTP